MRWVGRHPVMMAEEGAAGGGGSDAALSAGSLPPSGDMSPASTGAEGGNLLDWRSMAEPELRNDPILQKYGSASEALKALVHSERELGRRVRVPGEGATEQEWTKFYERLGRPAAPGDYTITEPMGEDGATPLLSQEFRTRLLEAGHAANLTPAQMQKMVDFAALTVTDAARQQSGVAALQRAEAERTLAQMFGASAPRILAQANMVFDMLGRGRFGGDYAIKAREEWLQSELANSPNMIGLLSAIWDELGEGRFVESDSGPLMSADALQSKRADLMKITMDMSRPTAERQAAQQELQGIYSQLARMQDADERRRQRYQQR